MDSLPSRSERWRSDAYHPKERGQIYAVHSSRELQRQGRRTVYRRFRERRRMAPDGLGYVSSWVDDKLARCYQVMETNDRRLASLPKFRKRQCVSADERPGTPSTSRGSTRCEHSNNDFACSQPPCLANRLSTQWLTVAVPFHNPNTLKDTYLQDSSRSISLLNTVSASGWVLNLPAS